MGKWSLMPVPHATTRAIIPCVLFMLVLASSANAQWKLVKIETHGPKLHPDALAEDIWLTMLLRNDSRETLFVQGIKPGWYMVESFIKADGIVWERQNVGVDQKLEMISVGAGEQIEIVRRDSRKHVGHSILLTFLMARSEHDDRGTRILVGPFEIPAPQTMDGKESKATAK